jgi:hypothetical protein
MALRYTNERLLCLEIERDSLTTHGRRQVLSFRLGALRGTAAKEQDRAQVEEVVAQDQEITGESGESAFVAQAYPREQAAQEASQQGSRLAVVKLPETKQGVVLLPSRGVVERSFAWTSRLRRLVRDYARLPETGAG